MDQAIDLSSSSEADPGNEPFSFSNNFPAIGDEWLGSFNADEFGEEALSGPPKKPRVHGPDETLDDQAPPVSFGPNTLQDLQDAAITVPPVNEADKLYSEILEMFPGISHTYVEDLMTRHKSSQHLDAELNESNPGFELAMARDVIFEEILEQRSYPKEKSGNGKRKREEPEENKDDWESDRQNMVEALGYGPAA